MTLKSQQSDSQYTHSFSHEELVVIKATFKELASRSSGNQGKEGIVKNVFRGFFPIHGLHGERLFHLFDSNDDGIVDYQEFINGLATVCLGNFDEKTSFLFRLYDINDHGHISEEELKMMLLQMPKNTLKILEQNEKRHRLHRREDREQQQQLAFTDANDTMNEELDEMVVADVVGSAFEQYDVDHDERLSEVEFKAWVKHTPEILYYLQSVFPTHSYHDELDETVCSIMLRSRVNSQEKIYDRDEDIVEPPISLLSQMWEDEVPPAIGILRAATPVAVSSSSRLQILKKEFPSRKLWSTFSEQTELNAEHCDGPDHVVIGGESKHEHRSDDSSENGSPGSPLPRNAQQHDDDTSEESDQKKLVGWLLHNNESSSRTDLAHLMEKIEHSTHNSSETLRIPEDKTTSRANVADLFGPPKSLPVVLESGDFILPPRIVGIASTTSTGNTPVLNSPTPPSHSNSTATSSGTTNNNNNNNNNTTTSHGHGHTNNLHSRVYMGVLFKYGSRLKNIKARWYVLHVGDRNLYRFHNRYDKLPSGITILDGCYIKAVDGYKPKNKPGQDSIVSMGCIPSSTKLTGEDGVKVKIPSKLHWGIEIINPAGKSKIVYAATEHARNEWLKEMIKAAYCHSFEELYVLQEQIGVGRYCKVHKCTSTSDGTLFAVKVVDKLAMTDLDKQLMKTEMEVLRLVHHPRILGLERIVDTQNYTYIVLPFMRGGDLYDLVHARDSYFPLPWSEQQIRELAKPLLEGVHYLHSLGVAHRDLKLENILMQSSTSLSQLKICDFGVSAVAQSTKRLDLPCGTISYVAPEVIKGSYSYEVDLWSVGVILYYLASGNFPFPGGSDREIAERILKSEVTFDGLIWNTHTPIFQEFLCGLLNKSKSVRLTADEALVHPFFQTL